MSERFVTNAKDRTFPTATFFRVAYSTMCFSTSQLAVGSPPWNSIVMPHAVDWNATSTARSATSNDMSVS